MAYITGVKAGAGRQLVQHWWQWVLFSLTLGSILVGSCYIAFSVWRKLRKHLAAQDDPSRKFVGRVQTHLQKYAALDSQLSLEKVDRKKPKSLAIYLGAFDAPLTAAQVQLLSSRDAIILDPLQTNVLAAIGEYRRHAEEQKTLIGRLDLGEKLKISSTGDATEESLISGLDEALTIVFSRFRDANGQNQFTGILLANWESLPPLILDELNHVLSTLNLSVYLETSGPEFLTDTKVLASQSVAGLVFRNGLLLPDGQRRDCFGMEALRVTVKAFVSQACLRDFTVMAWETLDDDAELANAVLRRTFTWCGFYSVIPWIGPQSALVDASCNTAPLEPLSAFDWLKESRVMDLQKAWKEKRATQTKNTTRVNQEMQKSAAVLPSLEAVMNNNQCRHELSLRTLTSNRDSSKTPEWFTLQESCQGDPLLTSSIGKSVDGIGCFPIGLDVSIEDFHKVVLSQRNLSKLNLLDVVSPEILSQYSNTLEEFLADKDAFVGCTTGDSIACREGIEQLAENLIKSPDENEDSESVRMYLGLHSGFQRNNDKQFHAVYHVKPSGRTEIYVSKKVQDILGATIHTYLSSQGLTERQCLAAEISFARWQGKGKLVTPHDLPLRLVNDIKSLSSEESIHLLQRVTLGPGFEDDRLLSGIRSAIQEQLLDVPRLKQLQVINTVGYLNGSVSEESLVESRLEWHCQSLRSHPDLAAALSLFTEIKTVLSRYLTNRSHKKLFELTDVLEAAIRDPAINAVSDIFTLAVFCTMRKLAMEEVYIEVCDRNPLFNDQADQAAAFAELFALGSRCEAYFDLSPSQFGRILSDKFRSHYGKDENQPPPYEESPAGLNTAYSEAQIDVDADYKAKKMPVLQEVTFMSVFAIPALIDILLLSTTGHGLYLSAGPFMSGEEVHSATMALMISLLLSGAIGTWIACGGTYYMASMAFSAMNYFVITRLLAGFALTLITGLIGFLTIFLTTGGHAAVVFLFYLIFMTSYLCLLAALANYQLTGSAFQSGRVIIISCVPVLFISPLITMFVRKHNVVVYLTVLGVFVTLLVFGVRYTGSRWTTWYQKISLIDDAELRTWYVERSSDQNRFIGMPDPAILREARQELLQAVLAEQRKSFFTAKTQDSVVKRLANSYEATVVLMDWYCRITGVLQPIKFSSTWNMQTKVALNSLRNTQLGIRFHNGFLHWRQAGDEIGCTMLYFIVALLDKWVALLSGGQQVGLASTKGLVMPAGFGLAYYLIGAVLLDVNAHKLNEVVVKNEEEIVPTDGDIARAVEGKSQRRKRLYWKTLFEFLMWHVWGLAITSTLLWLFTSTSTSSQGLIVFLSYVFAYTGVLWYQYTKIFAGPHAQKPLLVGVVIGLPLGFILNHKFPHFVYAQIIALGVATWTVAILTLWAAKILGSPENLPRRRLSTGKTYRSYSGPGSDQAWSQPELQGLHEQLTELPAGKLVAVDPNSEFGKEVCQILAQYSGTKLSKLAEAAFPDAEALPRLSKALFLESMLTVEVVSLENFSKYGEAIRAVSSIDDGDIRLIIGCDLKGIGHNEDLLPGFEQDIAAIMINVAAEYHLKYNPRDALMAQSLWVDNQQAAQSTMEPSALERQLQTLSKKGDPHDLLQYFNKELARNLCLGFDCDLEWDGLPADIREYLVNRSLGIVSPLTHEQLSFLKERLAYSHKLDIETHLARCDYAVLSSTVAIRRIRSWIGGRQSLKAHKSLRSRPSVRDIKRVVNQLEKPYSPPKYSQYDKFLKYSGTVYHALGTMCKFFSVALVADPEFQREVRCAFPNGSNHAIVRAILLLVWNWSSMIQRLLLPTFLFHGREDVEAIWKNIQGMEVSLKRNRVLIRHVDGVHTGFIHPVDSETFKLLQYRGDHKTEPSTDAQLCATNLYTNDMNLLRRIEMKNGTTIRDYVYDYESVNPSKTTSTCPMTRREVSGDANLQVINYNAKSQIESGSYVKDGNLICFQYHYQKSNKQHHRALLRAEFSLPHMSCTVSWCAPPRRKQDRLDLWIPHDQVIEASFVVGPDVWESQYYYDHKLHPTIVTTLNGEEVDTPPFIMHDHLDVLKKPTNISFLDDNPLYSFKSIKSNPFSRWLGIRTQRYPVPTAQARSSLWKAWKSNPSFDGVIARWLDERLLRDEPVLAPYWRKRDYGNLDSAETYLDDNRDAVMAMIDLDSSISGWTPLAVKINDLYSFGQGGDACSRTRSNVTEDDDSSTLHVIAVDTGTWPNEGGGVSACRRDVVNNLKSIKWHMVAESANDFGIPKNQIERNVHSLKIIPLWGLDLMTPTHGLFTNRLDSEVDHLITHTTRLDIEQSFIPILSAMVNGSRALKFTMADIKQLTRALINLNDYFKDSRNWSAVWQSDIVKNAWRELWLSQTAPNAQASSKWLKTELPTLAQLDQGLELWSRYLFIFSIPVPEKIPAVFQTSHHSVSASYGVVCKAKRGCTLQIWDHAISWRETNLYLSSALCGLSPFTRNSLLGLMKMTSVVTLHHADTVLPCADFFNPGWEAEIGTCEGTIEHRALFKRKIDPVVNGITDMERFTPVKEIKTKLPTVTMLSHIWFAKDIKTALLAADIIINKWGFKDYRLEIYGALNKTPAYTTSCQEIIATKSLRGQVTLCGEANPIDVLQKTWVFLNSSISEGLPLALGEAALTGAPVVCTDVGASLRVLTDQNTGKRYSEVVAPNDALALARAQIKILGMLEDWSPYSDSHLCSAETKDSSFPVEPTPQDVARITKRMYEQSEARRRLGMKARDIVQRSFSGDRYLREHEQMLWIGKARKNNKARSAYQTGLRPPQRVAARMMERPSSIVRFREQSVRVGSFQSYRGSSFDARGSISRPPSIFDSSSRATSGSVTPISREGSVYSVENNLGSRPSSLRNIIKRSPLYRESGSSQVV